MFSGGDYDEVGRWLWNFTTAYAKRENLRAEARVDSGGPRAGRSSGLGLAIGGEPAPPAGAPPLELSFADVAAGRGQLAWCDDLAARVRAIARGLSGAGQTTRQ